LLSIWDLTNACVSKPDIIQILDLVNYTNSPKGLKTYITFPNAIASNFIWVAHLPFPTLSFPLSSFPFLFPLLFSSSFYLSLSFLVLPIFLSFLPLEVGFLKIPHGGLGEDGEFPQWGLGWSPSQNQIWCILALEDEI